MIGRDGVGADGKRPGCDADLNLARRDRKEGTRDEAGKASFLLHPREGIPTSG